MGKMKKYDSYKDSGIEWIGEIPSHWEISKSKFEIEVINGFAFKSEDFEDEGTPVIRIGDLKPPYVDLTNAKCVNTSKYKDLAPFSITKGDLLLAMTGATIGKTALYVNEDNSFLNQRVGLIRPLKSNDAGFIKYIYDSSFFREFVNLECSGSAQENIGKSQLGELIVAVPSKTEQNTIANYLDQKTAQIDDLIAKKERLIQLLEEERTAIINQAVTKGIDPTVPMKDSGIDWLGEIPAHWEVMRLRNIVDTVKTGSTPPSDEIQYFEPQKINWYGPGDFENLILGEAKRKISHLAIEENKCRLFPSNSILLIGIGATVGKVGLITEPSSSNQQINAMILKEFYNPIFYLFFLASIKEIIIMEASSATLPIFNQTQTKNIIITVPPIEEQNQIVGFIQNHTERIQTISAKTQQEIDLLKEYKTALISEVVTGKVDVRDEKLS